MDYDALAAELADDPAGLGYSEMDDSAAAAAMTVESQAVTRGVPMTDVLRWAVSSGALLAVQTAAAGQGAGTNATARTLATGALMMINLGAGTDLGIDDPEVAGMLTAMVQTGVLTAGQRDALVVRGARLVSRAGVLGLGGVTPGDVERARGGKW